MTGTLELRRSAPMAVALAVSWVGLYVHNFQELALPLWRPENSATLLLTAGLAIAWWRRPSRAVGMLLLIWVVLQIVGGAVLSVLPIGVFPFDPEQSWAHYGSHVLYGLLQLPLLVAAVQAVRTAPSPVVVSPDQSLS